MKIERILCPVDFSPASRPALALAAALAREFAARLTLLHVFRLPGLPLPDGVVLPGPEALQDLFGRVDRALAAWRADAERLGAPRVDTEAEQGLAWQEIVRRAADHDVVVMGTHGHTGLKHVLLGSVAERVVRRAPCPVLTVPATSDAERRAAPA